jgi:hypothetical protein
MRGGSIGFLAVEPTPEPALSDFGVRTLAAVRGCVACYGDDAATVEVEWSEPTGMHFVDVRPRSSGAASVTVGIMGDELWVRAGKTRFEIWRSERRPEPITVLEATLDAVFAGCLEEAGSGDDRFARISLSDGTVARFGAAHLPLPWSWRRRSRYAPYGQKLDRTD